jgi:hypothetical protein
LNNISPPEEDILKINMGALKRRMDSLAKEYNETYQKYCQMNLSEDEESASYYLDVTYLVYSDLHRMYRNFVKALEDALNSSDSGPTIEEVD